MSATYYLPRSRFDDLIHHLRSLGYQCLGPQIRDGAIVYDDISSAVDLPLGISVEQHPGEYRITQNNSELVFGWSNGPQALKPLTFRSKQRLWKAAQSSKGDINFDADLPSPHPRAVIGVRACDLAALKLQDAHFLQQIKDPSFAAERESLFLVAVNCSHPAETCFCASTGDGPAARDGYDLVLDELTEGFLLKPGSDRGAEVLQALDLEPANTLQKQNALDTTQNAAKKQHRKLPDTNLSNELLSRLEHSHWDEVAKKCLSCGNCTSVCPTCFCHGEFDQLSLNGAQSEHYRQWDSCFTDSHSYIHGLVIRGDIKMRYRQWLTHKFANWQKQYGRSGCTGCGRCITWCPVGIDVTEEINALLND